MKLETNSCNVTFIIKWVKLKETDGIDYYVTIPINCLHTNKI